MGFKYCSIASGSSGNCHYIETEEKKILIDAGLSGKKIQEGLTSIEVDPKTLDAIFVTHEHSDHIKGVGILSRRFDLPIYANEGTWEAMRDGLGKIKEENIKIFKTNEYMQLGDLKIHPFDIYHDAKEPVGYSLYFKDKKVSVVTDTGHICDNIKTSVKDSNLFVIESNHDVNMLRMGSYPWLLKKRVESDFGHLSNETAGHFIAELCNKKNEIVLLGHLSRENNFPELAMKTVENILLENQIIKGKDIQLEMANRDTPTKVFEL